MIQDINFKIEWFSSLSLWERAGVREYDFSFGTLNSVL